MRTLGTVTVLLVAAGSMHRLVAQCPDGSAPPCGRPARTPAPPANSVAVLYLDNLSRDTADAFLADGLTEEIIIRLGRWDEAIATMRREVDLDPRNATALDDLANTLTYIQPAGPSEQYFERAVLLAPLQTRSAICEVGERVEVSPVRAAPPT